MNLMGIDYSKTEKIINYTFKDKSLLIQAFTHSSYSNEHKNSNDYERLEFLGDALLGVSVGMKLYKIFPTANEGQLTKKRADLVSSETLSEIIDEYGLMDFLRIGTGDTNKKILLSENVKCDLFEAIIGAIFLDSNKDFTEVEKFIWTKLEKYIGKNHLDYKSKTLEYCAKNKLLCKFQTEKDKTEDSQFFICKLFVNDNLVSEGKGPNKLKAEKNACEKFYIKIQK